MPFGISQSRLESPEAISANKSTGGERSRPSGWLAQKRSALIESADRYDYEAAIIGHLRLIFTKAVKGRRERGVYNGPERG